MSDCINTIHARRSVGNLCAPAPTNDEINALIELAAAAPDHKKLRPWRFLLIESAAQKQAFSEAIVCAKQDIAKQIGATLSDENLQKFYNLPNRAPTILVCISDYKTHEKVPKFEQILSMGAAVQNILLGARALGYDSIWRTSDFLNHPIIKAHFGVDENNDIAAFVYLGTSNIDMPAREAVDACQLLRKLL